MTKTRSDLFITLCDCPHINLVIVQDGNELGRFACGAETAERIAEEMRQLAGEMREKTTKHIGHA